MGNLFEALPDNLNEEVFEVLTRGETTTIERIVSKGHTSPKTGWYDQEQHEWVVVLKGEALLAFEHGESVCLTEGSYINIPAHTKHRVEWTNPNCKTIWLAVHY